MRICIICGEEFSDQEDLCPYCGCPKDKITGQPPDFVDRLPEQYSFLRQESSSRETVWLFWDNERQVSAAVGIIPPGDVGIQKEMHLKSFQSHQDMHVFPELLRICGSTETEAGYYIYQDISGERLETLVERENPLNEPLADFIESQLKQICGLLEQAGLCHGDIGLHNLCITQDALYLTDFGSGTGEKSDREQTERIMFRLRQGYWEEDSNAVQRKSAAFDVMYGRSIWILAAVGIVFIFAIVIGVWLLL